MPTTRTPEGTPNRCPLCGNAVWVEPSRATGDAPCPHCGTLLWFADVPEGIEPEGVRPRADRARPRRPQPVRRRKRTVIAAIWGFLSGSRARPGVGAARRQPGRRRRP